MDLHRCYSGSCFSCVYTLKSSAFSKINLCCPWIAVFLRLFIVSNIDSTPPGATASFLVHSIFRQWTFQYSNFRRHDNFQTTVQTRSNNESNTHRAKSETLHCLCDILGISPSNKRPIDPMLMKKQIRRRPDWSTSSCFECLLYFHRANTFFAGSSGFKNRQGQRGSIVCPILAIDRRRSLDRDRSDQT